MAGASRSWGLDIARAFAALGAGNVGGALPLLRDLDARMPPEAASPLRAAALNNVGFAHVIAGRLDEATRAFEQAGSLWRETLLELRSANLPVAAGSSSFHFQLATSHYAEFAELHRDRAVRFHRAAAGMTRLNSSRMWRTRGVSAARSLADMCRAFGSSCPEAIILRTHADDSRRATLDLTPYQRKADRLFEIIERSPFGGAPDLCADIERAAYLTGLLIPGLEEAAVPSKCASPSARDIEHLKTRTP